MRARVSSLSPRAKVALAAGAVVLYTLVVWFLLVGPKRAEASSLSSQVVAAEAKVTASRSDSGKAARAAETPAADVVRLAKAMPSSSDQAGLVLELARLARESNVSLSSIEPSEPTTNAAGATLVPVTVVVTGTYPQVTRFLRNSRSLVSFGGGRVQATGRLLSVKSVALAASGAGGFPLLDATIELDAYAYDGPIAQATPPPPAPSNSTSTSGATAAGATR